MTATSTSSAAVERAAGKSRTVRACARCIIDSTVPNVKFDEKGVCNHCRIHDRLNQLFPTGEEGMKILRGYAERIKASARGKTYDCVVGFSGGRDTSYCLYMTKELGLNPLAVHFDNGWDSHTAKNNIQRICSKLKVDLHTIIADWEESRELTNCTIRASLPYIDLTDDIGIISALYRTAAEEGLHWIIHSHSFRTEGINPLAWNYCDARLVRSLIKRFCRIKLKQFQNTDLHHLLYWLFLKRINVLTITNYYRDSDPEVDRFLKQELGWEETGGWHYDNEIFGLACHYSRVKFGIDWRVIEYSALIREGVMTREEALEKLQIIPQIESKEYVDYALKKQGISPEEWREIVDAPPKFFWDYPTYYPLLKTLRLPIKLLCRLNVLPAHAYEKYFEL